MHKSDHLTSNSLLNSFHQFAADSTNGFSFVRDNLDIDLGTMTWLVLFLISVSNYIYCWSIIRNITDFITLAFWLIA